MILQLDIYIACMFSVNPYNVVTDTDGCRDSLCIMCATPLASICSYQSMIIFPYRSQSSVVILLLKTFPFAMFSNLKL